jgi:hypothetical protein
MSAVRPNPVLAVAALLEADTLVQGLCGANVFDHELPVAEDVLMPTKAIVVIPHGGPAGFATLTVYEARLALWCYGETQNLAYQVFDAAYMALKNSAPSVWAATYIYNVMLAGGPTPSRDPVLQWPYNISTFLIKTSDVEGAV